MIPNPVLQAYAGKELQPIAAFHMDGKVAIQAAITPAQLNAGYKIIAATGGNLRLRPYWYFIRVNAATVGAVTDVRLQTTDSTPVVLTTLAQANLTAGAIFVPIGGLTGQTLGAGYLAKGAPGQGLQLVKTGSDATGAFTIDLLVLFEVL